MSIGKRRGRPSKAEAAAKQVEVNVELAALKDQITLLQKENNNLLAKNGKLVNELEQIFDRTAYHCRQVQESTGSITSEDVTDRKSTRLNSSHVSESRMPSSA